MFGGKFRKNQLLVYLILLLIILGAIFLSIFPNIFAYINTPKGYVFSGQASWFDPWDLNVYVSTIRWGQTGQILLRNVYTSISNTPVFMYPLYTISGFLFTSINPFVIFYVLSALLTSILIVVLYYLSEYFLKGFNKLLAVFLIVFSGGLGWLFFPVFQSADLFMTGFTFYSQFQRAHEALGVSLYLISLVFFYLASVNKRFLFNFISLVSLIILCFIYPYNIISFFAISFIFSVLFFLRTGAKSQFKYLFICFIVVLPVLFFYYNHLQTNITFSSVLNQKLPTPNILEVFCGFGILIILFLIQFKTKTHIHERLFLNIWLITSIFLSYTPFGFARFYLRGLFFPLVILAILGLEFLQIRHAKLKNFFVVILILIVPISSIFIFYKRLDEVSRINPWFYIKEEFYNAIEALPKIPAYHSTILANYNLSNIIPAISNNKVYLGHTIQTPDFNGKYQLMNLYYSKNLSEQDTKLFLSENKIDYVFFDDKFIPYKVDN